MFRFDAMRAFRRGRVATAAGPEVEAAAGVTGAAAKPKAPPPRPIVFIHVPKSAGTTFANYLQRNCEAPEKAMLAFYGDYTIYHGKRDVPVVCAHAAFREMKEIYPFGRYVTWLRHPIDRAISQYKSWNNPKNLHPHWVENMPKEAFEHVYFAQKATLEEFVFSDHPEIVNNIRNVYCGCLSGQPFRSHRFLESAKENLVRKFQFFGLVEEFESSMRLFKHSLGWTADFYEDGETANRSTQKGVVPSVRAVERLMELNRLDMELYRFGRMVFQDRLRRLNAIEARRAAEAPPAADAVEMSEALSSEAAAGPVVDSGAGAEETSGPAGLAA